MNTMFLVKLYIKQGFYQWKSVCPRVKLKKLVFVMKLRTEAAYLGEIIHKTGVLPIENGMSTCKIKKTSICNEITNRNSVFS